VTLMLAYGMNSNVKQMAYRCPSAISLGRVDISDHRLVFRGCADVVYSPGDTVQCVLWDITKECEIALDQLEGYPEFYSKKFLPIEFMGHKTEAMIYYMVTQYYPSHPSTSYQNMLEEGYTDHGLDLSQIYQAEGFNQYEYSY
jgi:gamma-glutamylcyclotransferase (GGCT)/AIG2-like uncharacterized protein YtfP